MPRRNIVHIDQTKCDGCGECVPSCAEGAVQLVEGKARLVIGRISKSINGTVKWNRTIAHITPCQNRLRRRRYQICTF